jgi:hypothetical protein
MRFSYLNFKKVGIGSIEDFELLILEMFGGFSVHFDLSSLNQRK